MAKSLNSCSFIGNLTKDVDLRYSAGGAAIANFSIACNDSYKNKNTGEQVDTTEFVNIVAFGKLGEIISQYTNKGSKIYVSGKLRTEKYEKDGQTRYSTKIEARDMLLLDGRQDNQASKPSQQAVPTQQNDDFDDSDIPF